MVVEPNHVGLMLFDSAEMAAIKIFCGTIL